MRSGSISDVTGEPREVLASHPLLAPLPAAARTDLLRDLRVGTWETGEHVLHEGEASAALFVLLEGEVRVTVRVGERDVELARLGAGAVFGEAGLLLGGPRSATVTAHGPIRCAEIPAAGFERHLAGDRSVRRDLERLSARRLAERLTRSVATLRGLDLGDTEVGEVRRERFAPGRTILAAGAPSDAVYFLLRGVAVALDDAADRRVALSRAGPGQCVGELGVIRRCPRSASVVAETEVHALRVEADRFRRWVRDNPALADHLGTLERVYPLANGRLLSVYRSEHDGREAITTLAGDPSGDCVLSTKVLGADVVVMTLGEPEPDGEVEDLTFAEPGRVRRLALDRVERDARGRLASGRLRSVEVQGAGPDVSSLYHALRTRERLPRRTLARFRRSGYLGGVAAPADADRVCNCLEVGRTDVLAAAEVHGGDADAVVAALGIGTVCGACRTTLERVLAAPSAPVRATVLPRVRTTAARSGLVPRRPEIRFELEALRALRGEPELHVVAVASVFATVGERFMIRHIGREPPSIRDAALAADVEAFLEQESLHVCLHEPFNHLLLDVLYRRCGALHRAAHRMLGGVERLPREVGLAVCAAFEHAADGAFDLLLARYYAAGRRFSRDDAMHAQIEASGAGPLLVWHGAEELTHRHVAADVLQAAGGGLLARWLGFAVLGLQAVLLLLPAIAALRVTTPPVRPARPAHRPVSALRLVVHTALHGLRFLLPGFHPRDMPLPYRAELAADLARIPEA